MTTNVFSLLYRAIKKKTNKSFNPESFFCVFHICASFCVKQSLVVLFFGAFFAFYFAKVTI